MSGNTSRYDRPDDLTDDLITILGDDGFMGLVEAAGGTRLFVPVRLHTWDGKSVAEFVSERVQRLLSEAYGGQYIRVPLAREWRAVRYAAAGLSNARIAVKLGITETGVDKMFARLGGKPKARAA